MDERGFEIFKTTILFPVFMHFMSLNLNQRNFVRFLLLTS